MDEPLLFVLGDSISMQYGPYLEKMIAGRFRYARKTGEEEELAGTDQAGGANGGDSAAVLAYVEAMLAGGTWRPDLLLLNCGLHDLRTDPATQAKQVPLQQYRRNLRRIASLLGRAQQRTVWVRTTPIDDAAACRPGAAFHRRAADVQAYNASADEVMAAAGMAILDLFGFTHGLGGSEVFADHAHFAEPVREKQAAFVAGFLFGLQGRP